MLQPSCSLTGQSLNSKTHQLKTFTLSPSVVFLLFLRMNATVPAFVSSEPSTELLLIALSSSFFPATSVVAAAAAAASSSSSSSWSEYWLKASTSCLKISSLINPPSGRQLLCKNLTNVNVYPLNICFPQKGLRLMSAVPSASNKSKNKSS